MTKKPLIIVTNDDGLFAPGIKALIEVAKEFGEVLVVAPDSPQSGQGHAITLTAPLRLRKVDTFEGVTAYECSGTPADCVKLAKHVLTKGRKADLCLSGINHGSNAATNIIYSGTMSAAMEAAMEGIPAIGFSLLNYSFDADFSATQEYVRTLVKQIMSLPKEGETTTLLNVNIPDLPLEQIKGIKYCRQAKAYWEEEFQEGTDPRGEKYYWLSGQFILLDKGTDHDVHWLNEGYVSVVPSMHDLTDYPTLTALKK